MKKLAFIISILLLPVASLFAQDLYDINTITQIEITFAESNWDYILDTYYAAGDEERLVGSVTVNGIQFDSVGVRYKGNSSYSPNNVKNPFNIKLDHIIDDQTYQNYGTLKLANGFKDPSFVRETLSYEIARNYMIAGLANFCEVTVNEQYIGLYTSVQSVDKYFKNNHFPGAVDVRFKGELSGGASPTVTIVWGYHGADSSSYYDYYELKSDEGWSDLIDFLEVFNNNPDEMADYLNVDNHLWMLAYDNLTVNLDAPINFGHNFYLFKDGSDRFNPILWDLNENFGAFSMLLGGPPLNTYQLQTLDPLLNMYDSYYPIIGKVLNIDKYKKMYIAHMRTIIEDYFENGLYETRAQELQDIIDSEYQNDPNTFYSYSEFNQNITSTVGGMGPGSQPVVGLTQLMDTRSTWLLNQSAFQGAIPEISNQNYTPQFVAPGTTTWINADVTDADDVFLYYRLCAYDGFSALEMYDDGNHNDGTAGDGTYGVSIQVGYDDVNYYFYAQNSDQGVFFPQRASHEYYEIGVIGVTGDVLINEINYNSEDDFDPDDWIELYNNDDQEVDISGWIVKDDNDDHIFVIPDNTVLGLEEYLVLCVDSSMFKSCFPDVENLIGNLDFGFGGGGDQVRLFNVTGALVDSVEYDDEDPWPTEPDGNGPTLELLDPNFDNTLAENWHASTEHGTPGSLNSSGVGIDDPNNDRVFSLKNYPNPFTNQTKISFSLPQTEFVEVTIYNIKGQIVKTLLKDSCNPGEYSVMWDGKDNYGSDLKSGIYLYRLSVDGEPQMTEKMILMK
ncbi:MAG: CotH kinase family protein [Candidatus Cloacimonetes bacterium]|nr:CotH kinase family protein [Candidatus Cloacimonadota bacterium]